MKSILDGGIGGGASTVLENLTDATKAIQQKLSGAQDDGGGKGNAEAPDQAPQQSLVDAMWSLFAPSRKEPDAPNASADARTAPPLGEVLNLLQKGVVPVPAPNFKPHPRPTPAAPKPKGAQFLSETYAGPAGSRAYKLFVPSHSKGRTGMPLIVMLHGCTQNPDDFALGTGMNALAETRGCLVAYPQQSSSANNMACWNWFNLKDQARDMGEPAILAGLTREIMAAYEVDPRRVFVAGLSAGGAMAAILTETYPDLFSAAGIHSGLPYGAASDLGSALNAMRKGSAGASARATTNRARMIVFHGEADRTVHPANGELIVAAARAGLGPVQEEILRHASPGGVAYTRTIIAGKLGAPQIEHWSLEGMGHAWSGGDRGGSYTDPNGPNASREMMRFFLD